MRVHPRLREAAGLPSRKRSMKPKTLARALAALCVAAAGLLYAKYPPLPSHFRIASDFARS